MTDSGEKKPISMSSDSLPGLLVTIDGPAGAGKTTVSRMLADRLQYLYVDTGALYRGVAYEAVARGVSPDDDAGLESVCRELALEFKWTEDGIRLLANGRDISDHIRTPEISMAASTSSARPVVRSYLLELQRELGRRKSAVFEGRDMGTVVFPNADVKFFLEASITARAERRYKELAGSVGVTPESVEEEIALRDRNDSSRKLSPLKPAEDAYRIDSTRHSPEEVVAIMMDHIRLSTPSL